jgi:hypothetical protein
VRDTVGQLPAPVGPTGGQVLDTVTGAVDGALGAGSSAPAPSAPSAPAPPPVSLPGVGGLPLGGG